MYRHRKKYGIQTMTVTGDMESPMAGNADHAIEVFCGKEQAGPKTKGYTCTILTLQLMALFWTKKAGLIGEDELKYYFKQIESIVENINQTIEKSQEWIDKNPGWCEAKSICVIGNGSNYGTALERSLKILEMFRRPVLAYNVEEYIHGPYNDSFIIFINSKEDGCKELDRFYRLCREYNQQLPNNNFKYPLSGKCAYHFHSILP